jgi:hypothetical protein
MIWAKYGSCVRDSRYTPQGVVRSTDQREYRIARPREGARPIKKPVHDVLVRTGFGMKYIGVVLYFDGYG